ncbi:hypothetical protein EJD97_000592 [Solanum chilense]|uniref:Uncharacterized protein n=1 Tax=Solanum chilense TaxID=4083 RepID=A0A6N2AMZ3_SOLCI|nr:hypothetical protein EJD97_000592 [Solanum chilense]
MTEPMTVRRTHDEPLPGPSCFTVTIEMSLNLDSFIYFLWFLLVLFAPSSTNIDSLQSIAPFTRLGIGSDDERDPEYVPPGTATPTRDARAARATPKKVASGIVTASKFDEECKLTGTPSGSAIHEQRASGLLGVSWSEEASGSAKVPSPATATQSVLPDEADTSECALDSPTRSLTPVADHPNRWLVLTGSLPTIPEIHNIFTRHRLEWTTRSLGSYSEELVSISLPAIRRYLYGENVDANRTPLTAEFNYQWQIVKDCQFLHEPSLRETTKRWMALHLSVDGEGSDWVCQSCTMISSRLRWALLISASSGMRLISWLHAEGPLELPPLGDNMDDTVAQDRTTMQDASETTDTTPVEYIPSSSTAPSSSRSALFPTLVPFSRVQKLEAQMATLLNHIQPWMQRSIAEAEEHLERRMVQHTERKIAESLLKDTVMEALFATSEIPPPHPQEHAKRRKRRKEDEARARKKERREMEAARRDSLIDEEARQMRAVKSAFGASSSKDVAIAEGTADSAIADEHATEGVHITEVVGSGEPDT